MPPRPILDAFASEFARARRMADQAAAQLSWDQLRESLDPETNSIAVVMKHVAGNLRSRWTEPLTTDGEKPWRNRDREFIDDLPDRAALDACWSEGWRTLDAALASFTDADLARTLLIRAEPHTLALALARSSCHAAYHAGQIVQAARVLASRAGSDWKTLTIPRGGSAAFNEEMGAASLSLGALTKGERRGVGSSPSSSSAPPQPAPSPPPLVPVDAIISQFDAALVMLTQCIAACPDAHWRTPIARYPFWQVAYHVLCFVDVYLAHSEELWRPRDGSDAGPVYHPLGRAELDNELASREFSRQELLAYASLLRDLMHRTIAGESAAALAARCGFPNRPISRAELHIYNIRHVMHHTGQLSAALRRVGVDTRWAGRGTYPRP